MPIVSVTDGKGGGFQLEITNQGKVPADLSGTSLQGISNPVVTRPDIIDVTTTTGSVLTTSAEIIASRAGRRWLEIQNVGSVAIHILLAPDSEDATTAHRRLDPGEVFSFCNGVSTGSAVQAKAASGTGAFVAMEFH